MSIASVQKLQIFPLNQRSLYSFKDGSPIINLQIGRQNALIQGKSVYLNFKLKVLNPQGATPVNDPGSPKGNDDVFLNSRLGAWSVIDRLTVSEASRNQTIEGLRDVGRVLAAVRPASVSALDFNTHLNNKSLSGTRKHVTATLLANEGIDVSLRLADLSGFLNHGPIPLNQIPLNISIQLAPDAQALQVAAVGTDPAERTEGKTGMTYSLSDVFLSADLLVPDAAMATQLNKQSALEIGFDSYSNIFNVQNSSNQTTSLQLGLSSVKSVFTTVAPPDAQNNFIQDSFTTGEFKASGGTNDAKIDRVSFLRASMNFPIENELEVNAQSTAGLPLTPVLKHGLRSVGRWNAREVANTLTAPCTQNGGRVTDTMFDGTPFSTVSTISQTQPEKLRIYGVDMDSYSNAGLDFSGVTCGLRVNMDSASAMGLHTTAIARHTVLVKNEAVSVVS